jgi:hypothetical protein
VIDPRKVPVRFSRLKNVAQSLATYRHSLESDDYDTPALRLGRCTHLHLYRSAPFHVYDGDRRGKAWEKFRAEHTDAEIFTAKEAQKAKAMASAVASDPVSRPLIEAAGEVERTLHWKFGDRECHGTPDKFSPELLIDLKSTRCAKEGWFKSDARRFGYAEQVSWYRRGIVAAGLPMPRDVYIIAVESKAPYLVSVVHVDESKLDEAERNWRLWLEQLRVAEDSNHFPGYAQHVIKWSADADEEPAALIWGDEDESEAV